MRNNDTGMRNHDSGTRNNDSGMCNNDSGMRNGDSGMRSDEALSRTENAMSNDKLLGGRRQRRQPYDLLSLTYGQASAKIQVIYQQFVDAYVGF